MHFVSVTAWNGRRRGQNKQYASLAMNPLFSYNLPLGQLLKQSPTRTTVHSANGTKSPREESLR